MVDNLIYSVEIIGKKVDIVYKTSDEVYLRNFLKHVMETSSFEDLSIKIRGPAEAGLDFATNLAFSDIDKLSFDATTGTP